MIPISKPSIERTEIEAVNKVLKSGYIVQGPKTAELEELFKKYFGAKYAIAVNNGTSALHTALHAVGIGSEDEIITTPFTFIASANSILMTGAIPIFVDIKENTYNINPKLIEKAITHTTKAILAVDLYGQPADYKALKRIAKKHNLLLIEDSAQSIFATQEGKYAGNLADISCFSLYATKNIMSGEGGMITTNSKSYEKLAKLFRHHGQDAKKRYEYFGLGYNYRMTDLHAAIAIEQMKKGNKLTQKRQQTARKYNKAFEGVKGLITPHVENDNTHVYHQYTLRITEDFPMNRDELQKYLLEKDIQTNIYYPIPLYNFKHLNIKKCKKKDFPITEQMIKEVLSIPIHPVLTDKDVQYIIETLKEIT